jgi:hypothetical protein
MLSLVRPVFATIVGKTPITLYRLNDALQSRSDVFERDSLVLLCRERFPE